MEKRRTKADVGAQGQQISSESPRLGELRCADDESDIRKPLIVLHDSVSINMKRNSRTIRGLPRPRPAQGRRREGLPSPAA
jgi:hypothetical protein